MIIKKERIVIYVANGKVIQVFAETPQVEVEVIDADWMLKSGTPSRVIDNNVRNRTNALYVVYG